VPWPRGGGVRVAATTHQPGTRTYYIVVRVLDDPDSRVVPRFSAAYASSQEVETSQGGSSEDMEACIRDLFLAADAEVFEDGFESSLSTALRSFVSGGGVPAVFALATAATEANTNPEVAVEVLKTIGRLDDDGTREARRQVLERALEHPSPRLRDAAALGLASIDDPASRLFLEKAISAEKYEELRLDLMAVADQLQRTK